LPGSSAIRSRRCQVAGIRRTPAGPSLAEHGAHEAPRDPWLARRVRGLPGRRHRRPRSEPLPQDQSNDGKEDSAYLNPDGIEVEVDLQGDVTAPSYRIMDGPASWRDMLIAVRRSVGDSTFGVSGVRDNCYTPTGSRCH
jgi:hypothetical protein